MLEPPDSIVVANERDAARVAVAAKALASILLKHDPRVQGVYNEWSLDCATRRPTHEREFMELMVADYRGLKVLVDQIGLARFGWLPKYLYYEFCTKVEGADWEITIPEGLAWVERGRGPKRGEIHREDIPEYVLWFYRTRVKVPAETPYAIAKQVEAQRGISQAKSYVRDRIARAENLLSKLS
jgi:hypothetical protein